MIPRQSSSRTVLLIISLSLLSLAAGATAWRIYRAQKPQIPASLIVLPEPRDIADFALTDEQNQPFSLADFQGRWSVLFFGFTSCPDVCPTTLYQLQQARKALLEREDELMLPRFYLVSVDPQRDTPQKLAEYLSYFDPSFRGLTGAPEQLDALALQLGIAFFVEPHDAGDHEYTVDHSTALLLLNPRAQLVAVLPAPHEAGQVADDLLAVTSGRL